MRRCQKEKVKLSIVQVQEEVLAESVGWYRTPKYCILRSCWKTVKASRTKKRGGSAVFIKDVNFAF